MAFKISLGGCKQVNQFPHLLCFIARLPVIECANDSFRVTVNTQSQSVMFEIPPSVCHHLTPNSRLPASIPSASAKHRIPLSVSLRLFVLTSFTTMLAAPCPSFSFPPTVQRTVRLQMAWTDLHPFGVFPLHSLLHNCGPTQLQQYKHTESLHSSTPCACCCLVCLASCSDCWFATIVLWQC